MSEFLTRFVDMLATLFYIALIGRVILSWLNVGTSNPLYPLITLLYQVTEPILAPIRRILPRLGMLDLSPMVAILLISLVQRIIRASI